MREGFRGSVYDLGVKPKDPWGLTGAILPRVPTTGDGVRLAGTHTRLRERDGSRVVSLSRERLDLLPGPLSRDLVVGRGPSPEAVPVSDTPFWGTEGVGRPCHPPSTPAQGHDRRRGPSLVHSTCPGPPCRSKE